MECEKCLSPWNTETHVPKILACGHTICRSCLYEIVEKIFTKEQKVFKCPICSYEIMTITNKEDIDYLKKNFPLLMIVDKLNTTRNRLNVSNNMSLNTSSFVNNNNIYSNNNNIIDNSINSFSNKENEQNINNNTNNNNISNIINIGYYPQCTQHQNKANFYYEVNSEKKYVCNICIANASYDTTKQLFPIPGLNVQNELKISSCKKKFNLLKSEISKIESFLEKYQKNFETKNKKKIDELFEYINQIVQYNYTTSITLFNQCKNEQKSQIENKLKELSNLKIELDSFNQQLDNFLNDIPNNNPETQTKLDNIYNRIGNYINYENELCLFQMDINLNDEIKESFFKLMENSHVISVDFLKMKNGELPNIKELLQKNLLWSCSCGKTDNKSGTIICKKCSKFRGLETYNNILFNPLIATKREIDEFEARRKHEKKIFRALMKRNNERTIQENSISLFAIDTLWFNKWKTYVTNDLSDKILSNEYKYISDNMKIGVLPPDSIDNSKICRIFSKSYDENNKEIIKYTLKNGLKVKQDYLIINQYLWEWLFYYYGGGPEIEINQSMIQKYFSNKPKENEDNYATDENYDLGISELNSEQNDENNSDMFINMTNKINPVNRYTFNTKFSDLKTNKQKKEFSYEDVEISIDKNISKIDSMMYDSNFDSNKK